MTILMSENRMIQQLFVLILSGSAYSFSPPKYSLQTSCSPTQLLLSSSSNSNDWMESLRARQLELDKRQEQLDYNWRNSKCQSTMPLSFPDWVRRLDIGDYPIAAVGTSSGNVFCANLETGKAISRSIRQEEEAELEGQDELMRTLFSSYDGGGTLAIAMHKMLICSASRQGSVQIWRLDPNETELISQGSLQALRGVIVTCLELDDDYLWVGTADGRLQAYEHQSVDMPLALRLTPDMEWKFQSAILSLSLCHEMGHGVASTAKGTVELFSMEDDDAVMAQWKPPLNSFDRQLFKNYILCCTLVPLKDERGGYAMMCGCSDGSIYMQPLNYENGMFIDDTIILKSSGTQLQPRHSGAVKCMATPLPGLMLSGGQDGNIRVWNISEKDSRQLYQFIGYKVWLGSLWTDGSRVVSDGADNSIIVHDFSDSDQ